MHRIGSRGSGCATQPSGRGRLAERFAVHIQWLAAPRRADQGG
jgi:hypothetical protein